MLSHQQDASNTQSNKTASFTFRPPPLDPKSASFAGIIMDESWDEPEKPQYKEEPILVSNNKRFVLFPIKWPLIWQAYKHAESKFWTAEEVELMEDEEGWATLTRKEQSFMIQIIALLSLNDKLLGEDYLNVFSDQIQSPEARCMFGFQIMQKNIHTELWSVILDLLSEEATRDLPGSSVKEFPSLSKKKAWVQRYLTETEDHYCLRIVSLMVYTNVFLSGINAILLHVTGRNPCPIPGVVRTLAKIYRDHSLYNDFYLAIYKSLVNKPKLDDVHAMVRDAVQIEKELVDDLFAYHPNVSIVGIEISPENVKKYVESVANQCLSAFDFTKVRFAVTNDSLDGLNWVTNVLEEEIRKDENELEAPMAGIIMEQSSRTYGQINVRQEFSLDEDF